MFLKLLRKQGETLTEALVSILIIALSAAMLATMIATAVNINMRADDATRAIYVDLSAAETRTNERTDITTPSVSINSESVTVKYYGTGSGALISYVREEGTP